MISNRSVACCLVAVSILFGTAFAQSSSDQTLVYDSKLEVKIRTVNGLDIILKGPNITLDDAGEPYYAWRIKANLKSPDSRFSAVQYYGSRPKYYDGVVYLINPDGKVTELKKSNVNSIQWTKDSKYLLGFGDNTFRIWNSSRNYRQLSFVKINDYWYSGKSICLDVNVGKYTNGEYIDSELIQIYSVPSLKMIKSVPALEGTYCEHQP